MLTISNLSKSFNDFEVLQNVNWQIPRGNIIGLIGSNGAGKSTLLRCVASVYDYEGQVEIEGKVGIEAKRKLFFVSDEPFYFSRFSTYDMKQFYKSFYEAFSDEYYQHLIALFHFNDKKPINQLSKGLKRQCALILALSCKPRLLLMDESFDGLDPMMRMHLKRELIRLVQDEEITVVISSHNIRELEDICDGMALLDNKNVVFTKTLEELNSSYRKVQLGYKEAPDVQIFKEIPLLSYEFNNKIVTVIFKDERAEEMLKRTNPILVNPLSLSMEEIFVHEMEVYQNEQ